jgi:hypothetical protein
MTRMPTPGKSSGGSNTGRLEAIRQRALAAVLTAADVAAAFAVKSDRLTDTEKQELAQLREQAKKVRRKMSPADQSRYFHLIRKGVGEEIAEFVRRRRAQRSGSGRSTRRDKER